MNKTKNNYQIAANNISGLQYEDTKTEALKVAAQLLNDDDCKYVTVTKIEVKSGDE